jgi:hypothetical protein
MTLLGKILVIVNLFLSVAVGALIVMTYVARTNWHHAWQGLDAQMTAYRNNTNEVQAQVDAAKKDLAQANAALQKAQADTAAAVAQGQNDAAALKQEIARLQKDVHDRDNLLAINQGQLDSRQKEVAYMRDLARDLQVKLRDKEREAEDYHRQSTQHEIERNQQHEYNDRLLRLTEQQTKEIQKLKQGQTALASNGGSVKNPPAEDVDGLVKAVDPESGLITITIGSDAGLSKGNTLEVYRLKPEATYLGTVVILMVRPNEAVARPLTRVRGAIRVGDTVATNILSKR